MGGADRENRGGRDRRRRDSRILTSSSIVGHGARFPHAPRPTVTFGDTLPPMESDAELIRRLRVGDEQAFVALVKRYNGSMLRIASSFVPNRAVAEEVVQDTWLAVLRGIARFEGRSSLRTWMFAILVNRARSTGTREQRSIPVADAGPVVDGSRFALDGAWLSPPEHWIEEAEDRLAAGKLADLLRSAMDDLPARQREVVALRDMEGMSSEEVCEVLAISEGNQRVLLHRGRSKLRQTLETALRGPR
jgi:RNA polymerase sigma-70 factor, ECF subfamily